MSEWMNKKSENENEICFRFSSVLQNVLTIVIDIFGEIEHAEQSFAFSRNHIIGKSFETSHDLEHLSRSEWRPEIVKLAINQYERMNTYLIANTTLIE